MTNLPTDAIEKLLTWLTVAYPQAGAMEETREAKAQLTALLDDNHKKEAQIIELKSKIVDIHRHYGAELGD